MALIGNNPYAGLFGGGGGGSVQRGGNASTGVNVNFQPAANYWDGDNFVIPGITPGYSGQGQAGQANRVFDPQNRINRLQGRIDSGNLPPEILARLQQRLAMLQGGQQQAAPTQTQGQGFKSFAPYNLRPYGGLLG